MKLLEKDMEDLIIENPLKYLKEPELKLVSRQYSIGKYRFDLLFEDRHQGKIIVEIQRGTLDRNHTYKILDYFDEYKKMNPNEFIDLIIIANKITRERRDRLKSYGISYFEIPESIFLEDPNWINKKLGQDTNITNLAITAKTQQGIEIFNRPSSKPYETGNMTEISERTILIRLNRLYYEDISPEELYEATRGIWKVGKRRNSAQYAFSIYRGFVKEVYQIKKWYPACTLEYKTRNMQKAIQEVEHTQRWEFEGEVASEEIRKKYLGHSVQHLFKKGAANPIMYINC